MPLPKIVILGAGPAGLTAAWELSQKEYPIVVWEADPHYVGGIARTVEREGYRFDIGGHRFFSKSSEINEVWQAIMPEDFRNCPRLSRIYYNNQFFNYPIEALDAFFKLGFLETTRILFSYLKTKIHPISPELSFTDWVSNRFGQRLFEIFFQSYTEKVWGIPCHEISADWAAQRIKGLSLREAITNAFSGKKASPTAKTLIRQFFYPRLGPGQMWEKATEQIHAHGGHVQMDHSITEIHWKNHSVYSIHGKTMAGEPLEETGNHFISSIPLKELILGMRPLPPPEVLSAAKALRYRDFLTVCLIVNQAHIFPDTWIYIHDPKVKVGRIQNYKNWSPDMVPSPDKTSLGLEYFCFEGDGLWTLNDQELQNLATQEILTIGLTTAEKIEKAFVVRMTKAYPIYDHHYQKNVNIIRQWLNTFHNLQPVGRNGLHRYNNQDHSMMTAMLAARNIQGSAYDCWAVNTDAEYHEATPH